VVEEKRIEVAKDVELRVLVRSRGDAAARVPFVLVHGLASNAHLWDDLAARLAVLGHASAAVDLRGHGPAGRGHAVDGAGAFSFDAVTDDLVAVIDALGWRRPVLVGQSWGGNVVVEAAARHRESIRGIACIDGGTIELRDYFASFEACAERLSPPDLVGTPVIDLERVLRELHPDWPESGIAGQLGNFEVRADGTVAPWLTRARHMAILRVLFDHRPSERWLAARDVPLLFVPAKNAHAIFDARREIDRAAGALDRCRVEWIAGDHDLHAQFPERIAELLHTTATDGFFG